MQTNFFITDWEQHFLFWYLDSMNRTSFLSGYLHIEKEANWHLCVSVWQNDRQTRLRSKLLVRREGNLRMRKQVLYINARWCMDPFPTALSRKSNLRWTGSVPLFTKCMLLLCHANAFKITVMPSRYCGGMITAPGQASQALMGAE